MGMEKNNCDEFKLTITEVSDKIPMWEKIFTSSNEITFRVNGGLGFANDDLFDLPQNDCNNENDYGDEDKERLEIALPEFHEFCLKTYGSKSSLPQLLDVSQDITETTTTETIEESSDVKEVIQGIEELVQQEHDNTINSLKGLLKDRFNYLLEYPYEYSKGYIESFLSDLIDEIEEF